MKHKKMDYASAGVDIAAADCAKEKIKLLARETFNRSVLSEIGAFGGFFKPDLKGYAKPVLVSSCDSVGTKLKIAFMANRHDTIGEDIVNHCINDILVHGAKPLFFLDYIGIGKLQPAVVAEIVKGLSNGCKNAGMALIGGETAELPDLYAPGEYDLAGFIVGIVDQNRIIDGTTIKDGDAIIGLGSNGLHTNGYSLARKIVFEMAGHRHDYHVDSLGMAIGEALLMTHRSYLKPIMSLLKKYNMEGMAHITGSGIGGNLVRILSDKLTAVIHKGKWPIPRIFEFLQKTGGVADDDMFQAFNMGIGYIIVVRKNIADKVIKALRVSGEAAYLIGEMTKGRKEVVLKD
ncbi:MAG: phosphoribosylformylglycinamidine cyclo-ligase [candidate division Zixibacteria bacterium]|nr:phosphoribosylformylglycinamidine cyclo-ligase [candidate division Zixibacteria bacterium]